MAKKKSSSESTIAPASAGDFVDRIYEKYHKEFGEGSIISGSDYCAQEVVRIPISPALDSITDGGIDEGSFVGITGHQKTGKTNMALSFAANCQQSEFGNRPIFYGKAEGRLSREHTQGIEGLNTEKPHFNVIQSVEGRILSAQDHLKMYRDVLINVPGCVLIIDSISSLVDQRELDEGVGTQTRGSGARLFSQWLDLVKDVVVVNRCIVLGITHLISNTGGKPGGPQHSEKAARNWLYMCNYMLKTVSKTPWIVKEKSIGMQTDWVCVNKPSGGQTYGKAESLVRYGIGIDKLAEAIRLADTFKLITKKGAWYQLSYLAEKYPEMKDKSFNGTENIYRHLKANPDQAKILFDIIKGLFAPHNESDELEEGAEPELVGV